MPRFKTNYMPSSSTKQLKCGPGTRTKQQFKDECNINNIMKKFERTGELPNMIKAEPQYGDFSTPMEFQEAMNTVNHATEQFENLSAKVRERFGNDPAKFLEFATNGENAEEMAKMGLIKEEAVKRVNDARTQNEKKKLDDTVNQEIEKRGKKKD